MIGFLTVFVALMAMLVVLWPYIATVLVIAGIVAIVKTIIKR